MTQLSFYVNEPPFDGVCSLSKNGTNDTTFTALVDEITFVCDGWKDPEEIGIKGYILYSTDLSKNVSLNNETKKYY